MFKTVLLVILLVLVSAPGRICLLDNGGSGDGSIGDGSEGDSCSDERCANNFTTYLVEDRQCVDDSSLQRECGVALVPSGALFTESISSFIAANGSLMVLNSDTLEYGVGIVRALSDGVLQRAGDNCKVTRLSVMRGRREITEIRHDGFSVTVEGGTAATVNVDVENLAYDRTEYDGEVYLMNVTCSSNNNNLRCLFFKLNGTTDLQREKFNGRVEAITCEETTSNSLIDDTLSHTPTLITTTTTYTHIQSISITTATPSHIPTPGMPGHTSMVLLPTPSSHATFPTAEDSGGIISILDDDVYRYVIIGCGCGFSVLVGVACTLGVVGCCVCCKRRKKDSSNKLSLRKTQDSGDILCVGMQVLATETQPLADSPATEDCTVQTFLQNAYHERPKLHEVVQEDDTGYVNYPVQKASGTGGDDGGGDHTRDNNPYCTVSLGGFPNMVCQLQSNPAYSTHRAAEGVAEEVVYAELSRVDMKTLRIEEQSGGDNYDYVVIN